VSNLTLEPIEVFFSYSHRDELLRDELAKHLSILKRQGVITDWHDRQISVGTEWQGAIDDHLNSAQIILLLISADFLASDYCYDIELRKALERYDRKEAHVIPIILRPVDWHDAPFGKLQALPKNAQPITIWANSDEAFLDVARGIRQTVEQLKREYQRKLEQLEQTQRQEEALQLKQLQEEQPQTEQEQILQEEQPVRTRQLARLPLFSLSFAVLSYGLLGLLLAKTCVTARDWVVGSAATLVLALAWAVVGIVIATSDKDKKWDKGWIWGGLWIPFMISIEYAPIGLCIAVFVVWVCTAWFSMEKLSDLFGAFYALLILAATSTFSLMLGTVLGALNSLAK
jgi:hypothetical protein